MLNKRIKIKRTLTNYKSISQCNINTFSWLCGILIDKDDDDERKGWLKWVSTSNELKVNRFGEFILILKKQGTSIWPPSLGSYHCTLRDKMYLLVSKLTGINGSSCFIILLSFYFYHHFHHLLSSLISSLPASLTSKACFNNTLTFWLKSI